VITTGPPFASHLVGYYLKKRHGLPWIADYRDPWTSALVRVWPTKLHFILENRWENTLLRHADAILCVTPSMCRMMEGAFPHTKDKLTHLPNGFDPDDYPAPTNKRLSERFTIGFAGTLCSWTASELSPYGKLLGYIGRHFQFSPVKHDLTTHSPLYLLRGVRHLLDTHPCYQDRLQCLFIGELGEENRSLVSTLGLQQLVSMTGRLATHEALATLAQCDAFFLPMRWICGASRGYDMSGKVFDYLALRKPILALIQPGDLSDLIEKCQAGICVNPYDTPKVAAAIKRLIDVKSEAGYQFEPNAAEIARYEYPRIVAQLAEIIKSVVGSTDKLSAKKSAGSQQSRACAVRTAGESP